MGNTAIIFERLLQLFEYMSKEEIAQALANYYSGDELTEFVEFLEDEII